MSSSVGTLTGPLSGDVLYQHLGYGAVFGLGIGLIGLDILLRLMLIERKHAIGWLAPGMRPLLPSQDGGDSTDPTAPTFSLWLPRTTKGTSVPEWTKKYRGPLEKFCHRTVPVVF